MQPRQMARDVEAGAAELDVFHGFLGGARRGTSRVEEPADHPPTSRAAPRRVSQLARRGRHRPLRAGHPWHSGRAFPHAPSDPADLPPVTPTQLAIYAAEVRLIMTGLAFLAALFFAAALLFAFFFGTVNPRLRRATERNRRLSQENAALRAAAKALKGDVAAGGGRIAALEKMVATFEREIHRLDGIRKRSDTSLLETKTLLARLQENAVASDDR